MLMKCYCTKQWIASRNCGDRIYPEDLKETAMQCKQKVQLLLTGRDVVHCRHLFSCILSDAQ